MGNVVSKSPLSNEFLLALSRAWEHLKPFLTPERTGGYVCLALARNVERPIVHGPFGKVPVANDRRYFGLAMEKAERLSRHPDHLTSRESMNELHDEWPGAIRVHSQHDGELILSFSGLPAAADEALMLLTALELGWMDEWFTLQIATRSQDPDRYFEQANELRIKAAASA